MEQKTGTVVIDLRNTEEIDSKLIVVKAFKDAFGLTLKEAKDLADEYFGKIFTVTIEYVVRKLFKTQVELIIEVFNTHNIKNVKYFYDYRESSTTKKNSYKEVEPDVVEVGSVYILSKDKYEYYRRIKSILTDLFGTVEHFKQVYDEYDK